MTCGKASHKSLPAGVDTEADAELRGQLPGPKEALCMPHAAGGVLALPDCLQLAVCTGSAKSCSLSVIRKEDYQRARESQLHQAAGGGGACRRGRQEGQQQRARTARSGRGSSGTSSCSLQMARPETALKCRQHAVSALPSSHRLAARAAALPVLHPCTLHASRCPAPCRKPRWTLTKWSGSSNTTAISHFKVPPYLQNASL
jgi:hypothetical protein